MANPAKRCPSSSTIRSRWLPLDFDATLKELGVPNAKFSITDTTILVRDGCCIGRSFTCGHVRVVIRLGGQRIEFCDRDGRILRVICHSQSLVAGAWAA